MGEGPGMISTRVCLKGWCSYKALIAYQRGVDNPTIYYETEHLGNLALHCDRTSACCRCPVRSVVRVHYPLSFPRRCVFPASMGLRDRVEVTRKGLHRHQALCRWANVRPTGNWASTNAGFTMACSAHSAPLWNL